MEVTTPKKRGSPKRNSRARSTTESRSSQKQKRKQHEEADPHDEEYFEVERILGQRVKGGVLEYWVDWKNNPVTGEVYEPTWVPREDCTDVLIESWEDSQSQSQSQHESILENCEHPPSNSSPNELLTRLEKRRRVTIESPSSSLQEESPFKRPRRAGTAKSARFQSVSQETFDSERVIDEIKDSYEEEDQPFSGNTPRFARVEINVPNDFDREAYATWISSQPSQSLQSSQNSELPPSTEFQPPTPSRYRPFKIWDEDIIPDTQDLPGSSTYDPSDTASDKAEYPEPQDLHSTLEESIEIPDSRSAQWPSSSIQSQDTGDIDSQLAESEIIYNQGQLQSSSPKSWSQGESSSKLTLEPELTHTSSGAVDDCGAYLAHQPDASVHVSIEVPDISDLYPSIEQPQEIDDQEGGTLQDLNLSSSDTPFLTQLPIDFVETNTIEPPEDETSLGSDFQSQSISEFSQHAQIVDQELSPQPSVKSSTERVERASSLDTIWPATQAFSSTSRRPQSSHPLAATSSTSQIRFGNISEVSKPVQARAWSQPINYSRDTPNQSSKLTVALLPRDHQQGSTDNSGTRFIDQSPSPRAPTLTPIPKPLPPLPLDPPTSQTHGSSYNSSTNFNMEEAVPESSSDKFDAKGKLAEMMAAARAKTVAKQVARAASSMSSSPSPAVTQNPHSIEANQMLPVFTPAKELSDATPPYQPSPKASPEVESESTMLRVITQGEDEYIVPLPMVSQTRDIYVQTLLNYKSQRLSFLTDEVFDQSLVGEIDNMLNELIRLCDHQDLILNDFSTQRMDSEETQAKWAENISTKCIFLAELLPQLQPYDQHIVVLVRSGRMLEILESLFKWHGFVYNRADEPGWNGNDAGGPMRVTLLPTGGEIYIVESASVVIAFDSTAESVSYLNEIRAHPSSSTLAPLVSLITTHSVEHLEKCFPTNIEPIERKIKIVSCLSKISDNVGKLDLEQYPDPPNAAKAVAEYVVNITSGEVWPIPPMPEIEGIDSSGLNSPRLYERNNRPSGQTGNEPSSTEALHSGTKRQSEDLLMEAGSPKRHKFTPDSGSFANNDESRVGDIILQSPSNYNVQDVSKIATPSDQQGDDVSSLIKRISDLETQLRRKEETETELRQINQDLESRCQDYESSIREIQPKYQEALNDRGQFESEVKLALERESQMRKQRDARDAELRRVKDQMDAVDAELTAARLALTTSTNPQVAELSKMKDEVNRANEETKKLQSRLANMQQDNEYMRTQYQNASDAAVESASDLRDAQALVVELRKRADGNKVRVHEIQRDNENAAHLDTIKELKAENEELLRELEKKDAELKAMLNGRRATRGTSVPRSPRMGGTMSPGTPRPIGRVLQSSGSRGNSPAPGEFPPNRMGGFGEALFQGPSGPTPARWGNHLQ